jgi:hypothetical protein
MIESANIEAKIRRARAFWNREAVDRPMIGFSLGGWFPLRSYSAMERLRGVGRLQPEMVRPEELFADYDRLIGNFDRVKDDVVRAVAPIPPFPWFEAMLGVSVEVGNESIWAREGGFDYADMDRLDFSSQNPWRRKYLELVGALADRYRGRVPVGQPILRGSSDMVASLRGSQQMIFDFYDCPEFFRRLAEKCTNLIIELVQDQHRITGSFAGGTVIEQFALWAPGEIVRMQEDASALFSPDLYVKLLQDEDRKQAAAFPYSLIHLHASSLHLIDRIADIRELGCIQINKDMGGTEIEREIPYFKAVQARGKSLLIRGKLTLQDLALMRKALSPRGLYLQIVVESPEEAESLEEFFRPWN